MHGSATKLNLGQEVESAAGLPDHDLLLTEEVAKLARVSTKRISNLVCEGVLREGVHFVLPRQLGRRFIRSAIMDWLYGREPATREVIPMANNRRRPVAGLKG